MLLQEARSNVGGLSDTYKMPGESFGLTIEETCHVGKKLAKIPGSVCSKCYADPEQFGRYGLDEVQDAQKARLDLWENDRELWKESMILIFNSKKLRKKPWFRWFDSGDIYSKEFLEDILEVCKASPHMNFWIPTKEYGIAKKYQNRLPDNVVMRVSHPDLNLINPKIEENYNWTSAVLTPNEFDAKIYDGFYCPSSSPEHNGQCKDCTTCWERPEKLVFYKYHNRDVKSVQQIWGIM